MHLTAVDAIVKSVRTRISQGDHPTEPAHSVETLEDAVDTLASQIDRLRQPTTALLEVPVRDGAIILTDDMRKAAYATASQAEQGGGTSVGIGVAVALAVLDAAPRRSTPQEK